jgi:hypothetical protein
LLATQRVHGGKKKKKISTERSIKEDGEEVPKEGAEIKHQSVSRYIGGTCRQFQHTCTLGGNVAKLVIDPMSGMNVVSEEAKEASYSLSIGMAHERKRGKGI